MKMFDVVVVGAGMVGLAVAAGLRGSGLSVALLEREAPVPVSSQAQPRVSALNLASQRFLARLGAWSHIQRAQPYRQMEVWEKDGFARLEFDAASVMQPELGHIVENRVVQQALWAALEGSEVSRLCPAGIDRVSVNSKGALLLLDDGTPVLCSLLVAADGAHSWLRQQFDIPVTRWDYGHSALVAKVRTAEPHGDCARQIFCPEGPLALLPLWQPDLCSIVWSLPPERAEALLAADEASFNKALTVAFDARLGLCRLEGPRQLIPLQARFARDFAAERLVLVGDAAHTVHPLAGQGANLGLMDAEGLVAHLRALQQAGQDPGLRANLRPWERRRKAEAAQMLAAMEAIKRLFAGAHPAQKLLRGIGMQLLGHCAPLKSELIAQAMGVRLLAPVPVL